MKQCFWETNSTKFTRMVVSSDKKCTLVPHMKDNVIIESFSSWTSSRTVDYNRRREKENYSQFLIVLPKNSSSKSES